VCVWRGGDNIIDFFYLHAFLVYLSQTLTRIQALGPGPGLVSLSSDQILLINGQKVLGDQ